MVKKRLCNIFRMAVAVAVSASLLLPAMPAWASSGEMEQNESGNKSVSEAGNVKQYDSIGGLSDEVLYDTEGKPVRACGGEVHQYTEDGVTKWYWFGEDVPGTSGNSGEAQGLHLYSSTDLYNWTREEDIFKGMTSKNQFETDDYFKNLYGDLSSAEKDVVFECLSNCPTAHPKMLYDKKKQKYVMWVPGMIGKQCIATSDSIKGPFKFVKYCEDVSSVGLMYQDSDGTAYAVYNGNAGTVVARLTDDYMGIDKDSIQAITFSGESGIAFFEGGMFKRDGKYYMVNTGMKKYAMTDDLGGPWSVHTLQMCDNEGKVSEFSEMNPTSCVLQVNTEEGAEYINITDKWSHTGGDPAKYIWLPLSFSGDGTMALKALSNWKLDGTSSYEPEIPPEPQEYDTIDGLSGEILYDTDGERVYACGGEVHQFTENGETKWYWFGVDDLVENRQKDHPGIHLYSSTDLYNWKHEGTMDEGGKLGIAAHPKVLYNEQQQQYVMWVTSGEDNRVIVATSKSIKGPFVAVEGAGRNMFGFINLYQDSDGAAYILLNAGKDLSGAGSGICLAKLSADYTAIDGEPQALQFTDNNKLFAAEGGIFERNGKYYIVNAGSPDDFGPQYAVADSLFGPWTLHEIQMWDDEKQEFEDIVRKNQTSNVFHVKTGEIDTYVCVGDSVNDPMEREEVRYIWLPIKFLEDGGIALEKLSNWKLGDQKAPGGDEEPTAPKPIEVTEVRLTEASKTLKEGAEYQITATVQPENAENKTLTYKSGDEDVATVSASGKVMAKKAGTTTITVTSANGKKAELRLTVEAVAVKPPEVQKVLVSTSKITLAVGERVQLEAAVYPDNARDKKLTYKPSNNNVKVDNKGRITAKKTGDCKITISSSNGKTAVVKVTVKKKPGKISLNAKKKILKVGKSFQIKVKFPRGTASYNIKYSCNKKSVASVSRSGKVTAKKKGNAVITVKTSNNKKAILKLRVK